MKTTIALFAFAALAALPSLAGDDVQITYRGQVRQIGTTTNTFDTHTMVFRLYAEKEDTEAAWTDTVADIPVDADGLFQVALRGDGLAKAIDDGKANWIGVTILTGADTDLPPQEQYPRQALLANPWAAKAALADALPDSPAIQSIYSDTVEANSLAISRLSVGKGIQLPFYLLDTNHYQWYPSMTIHLEGDGWAGKTVPVKGHVVLFDREVRPTTLATTTYDENSGCSFGEADCNCAVLFRDITGAENAWPDAGADRLIGMTLFFKKGEPIDLPPGLYLVTGHEIEATVHPIGND